jgi:hypothetical protein
MTRSISAFVVVAIVWAAAAVLWAPPVAAAASLTVTPHDDLVSGQIVTIGGSGWPANTDIGYCEAVLDSTPSQGDCVGAATLVTSSDSGSFVVSYHVTRKGSAADHGAVDCVAQQCVIAAAVYSDIANTVVSVDLSFNPAQIDARLKQRSSGAIRGDDVYDLSGQTVRRTFAPGGSFVFALQMQNDGPATDDVIVTAAKYPPGTAGHIRARYFVGYYDVTALVTGSGVRIRNLGVGQIRGLAVRVDVGADADDSEWASFTLSFASGAGGGGDTAQIVATDRTP